MAVTAKNYLTLVNDAIRESGTDLDSLTSSTFASPTDKMQVKFKEWVKQAWIEEQLARKATQLLAKEATARLHPRVLVQQLSGAITPAAGDYIQGTVSNARATIQRLTTVSGAFGSGTGVGYLDLEDANSGYTYTGTFLVGETVNLYTSGGTYRDSLRLNQGARYPLSSIYFLPGNTTLSDILEPLTESFFWSLADDFNTGRSKVFYLNWDEFLRAAENATTTNSSTPQFVTQGPDGALDFYPRLNQEGFLYFKYQAKPQELSAYTDTLTNMKPEYQDLVLWRAVVSYAQYDRKPAIERYARMRHLFYKKLVDQNLIQPVSWGPSVYGVYD